MDKYVYDLYDITLIFMTKELGTLAARQGFDSQICRYFNSG